MDHEMLERRLNLAERRIGQLERHIEQQRIVLAALATAGRGNSETAEITRDVLRTMERNLRVETADRKRLPVQLRRSGRSFS